MPLKLALCVRETVAGHRLGALEGGGGYPLFQCIPGDAPSPPHLMPLPTREGVRDPLPFCLQTASQLIALCGDVHVIFDSGFRPQRKSPLPVFCCSVPGINFAYSRPDAAAFTAGRGIDRPRAQRRMCSIWSHVLLCMRAAGVRYPCLNAIGCGAFRGHHLGVPELWAQALCDVLRADKFGFEAVIVCLPTFAEDNFTAFEEVFECNQVPLHPPSPSRRV